MRIQMHYGSQVTNPCATFDYDEVEDYTLNISGGSGFTTLNSQNATTSLANLVIGPNPVSTSFATVNYNLAGTGISALKVVDLSGRVLQVVPLGNQSAGPHSYNLAGLDRISAGNYILILEQNNAIIARNHFAVTK